MRVVYFFASISLNFLPGSLPRKKAALVPDRGGG